MKNVGNNEKHFDFTLSALTGFEAIGQADGPSAFPFNARVYFGVMYFRFGPEMDTFSREKCRK